MDWFQYIEWESLVPSTNEATLIILFSTLVAVIFQALAALENNKQSVRPYIHAYHEMDSVRNCLLVKIGNSGQGPAIIKDYCVTYKNKKYRGFEISQMFADYFLPTFYEFYAYTPGAAIPANYSQTILCVAIEDKNVEFMQQTISRIFTFSIKYKSFLGQTALYNSKKQHQWPLSIKIAHALQQRKNK